MANPENPRSTETSSSDRFKEAKKRYEAQQSRTNPYYSETLSSDPNSIKAELDTLRDFIKKNSELMGPRRPYTVLPSTNATIIAANRNNKGQDLLTNRIVDSQKDTTNAIKHLESTIAPSKLGIKPITKRVEGLGDNAVVKDLERTIKRSALVEPVKIDDSKIAQENTLEDVAVILHDILKSLAEFSKELIKTVMKLVTPLSANLKEMEDSEEKRQGWLTKWVENSLNFFKGSEKKSESLADTIARLIKPSITASKKSMEYLAGIYNTLRRSTVDTDTEQARSEFGPKTGMLAGLSALFSDTIIGKAGKTLANINELFKTIGKWGDQKLQDISGGKSKTLMDKFGTFVANLTGKGGLISLIGRFLGLFTAISSVITLVVGSVAFASAYAMFKHPEQFIGMLGAFSNLFTEAILPAFEWISKEIIPPLSAAFAALLVAGDYLLDTVGTYVNEKLIFIIGTALPDVLRMFGRMIDDIWQGLKEFTKRVAGIFGVGDYAGEGFIKNLTMAFLTLGDHLLQMVSEFSTEVIKSLGLADVFGLKEGEGIWGRIKRFFSQDIPNFAIKLFDQTVDYIQSLKPVEIMQEKIKEFISAITNLIPTWNDIKQWMVGILPQSTPDFVKKWFTDQLKEDTTPKPNENIRNSAASVNANSLGVLTGANMRVPTVVDNVKEKVGDATEYFNNKVDSVVKKVEPFKRNTEDYIKQSFDPFMRASRDAGSVIFAPTTNNTNSVQNSSSGGANRAIGTTTPQRSRLDDMIFRANPY